MVLVGASDQRGKQDILESLIHEVHEGQIAQFLKDRILTVLEHVLILLVQQAVVPNEKKCFVEQFSNVVRLNWEVCLTVDKQEIEEVVECLLMVFE